MGQTAILDETTDTFNSDTGEITHSIKHRVQKTKIKPTDEFIKVSKYLNLIYAYNGIPLNMVPISLLFAQRMHFKTNVLYLLKQDKEELAEMLGVSVDMVKKKIADAHRYDIIRSTGQRGKFVVNSFLFSTGSMVETRNLQAQFDFDSDSYAVRADQKNLITGEVVRKTVTDREKNQIPGQMTFPGLEEKNNGKQNDPNT